MILEFAVTNYRSVKERTTIDFRISGQVGKKELSDNLISHVQKSHGAPLVRVAVLYGANASGKSNLLKAIWAFQSMVSNSHKWTLDSDIKVYEPFKLDGKSQTKPTSFEIDFIAKNNLRYLYKVAFDKKNIVLEELFVYARGKEVSKKSTIFSRKKDKPTVFGDYYKGKRAFALLNNQLLLSKAGVDDLPTLVEPYRFFSTYLFNTVATAISFDEDMLRFAERIFAGSEDADLVYQKALISMVKAADVGISNIFVQKIGEESFRFPEAIPDEERRKIVEHYQHRIKTVHPIIEDEVQTGEAIFDLSEESLGTIKFLGICTFIVDALQDGSVVVVDELDKSLHPLLTKMIIQIFQNPQVNRNNAQLIFSTHDISLMDRELIRRDQVYLIDKESNGRTVMGRLSDISGISKVVAWQKWYMAGMLRGVPGINEYQIDLKITSQSPENV